jgi:hypothetical protein
MSGTCHLPEPGVWLLVVDYWRCQRQDSQRKTSGKKPSEDGSISVGQFCASEKGHALRPKRVNSIRPPTAANVSKIFRASLHHFALAEMIDRRSDCHLCMQNTIRKALDITHYAN